MKQRILAASILSLMTILSLGIADAQGPPEGKEVPLSPVSTDQKGLLAKGNGVPCGQYFYKSRPRGDRSPLVYFENKESGDPAALVTKNIVGPSKFVVYHDEKKSVPTVTYTQMIDSKGYAFFIWIIKISAKDFKEAQACLPPPQR